MDTLLPWMPLAIAIAGFLSGFVLWALSRVFSPQHSSSEPDKSLCKNTFILRDEKLFNHDVAAWSDQADGSADAPFTAWAGMRDWLEHRFGELPRHLTELDPGEERRCLARDCQDRAFVSILALRRGGHRVTLFDPTSVAPALSHDLGHRVAEAERFKSAISEAPLAICVFDNAQNMVWQNKAFAAFPEPEQKQLIAAARPSHEARPAHTTLPGQNGALPRHFEVSAQEARPFTAVFAADVTRQVKSDTSRGTFIQTLTKTFADLRVGLAVFNANRELVLFNPALTDLTKLPVDFLSARPGLTDFFDRLRDNQVLPEPKSYATWRAQISGIIDTTEGGHYCEAWSLPTGLTYRVTGRPHSDGSVAFLIEDISDEMSLTRRYRTQLDMRQAALNQVSEAVAVISPGGVVVFSNESFTEILGADPDEALAEFRATTLVETCRKRFPNPGFWKKAQDMVNQRGQSGPMHQDLPNGATCRIENLPGRFLFIGIRQNTPVRALSA